MLRSIESYRFNDISVELQVTSETFTTGATEEIALHMTDRTKRWELGSASVALDVYYSTEDGYETERMTTSTISDDLSQLTDLVEVRRLPLSIPSEVPNTIGGTDVAARITFESERATVDREAFLPVEPCPQFRGVLASLIDLGFVLENSECRADRSSGDRNFVQVLTFAPRNASVQGNFEAVDLFVRTGEESTTVAADVDSAKDSYAMPGDDARITLSTANPERIRPRIERLIESASSA